MMIDQLKKGAAIALILLAGAANMACAQSEAQRLDSLFRTKYKYRQLNGNVLVTRQGKTVFKSSYGFQEMAGKIPNSDATVFSLASISKTVTSTAVLQLVEKGKVHLDDPLKKYLPDFPYPTITIRHLLSHTSGLPDKEVLFNDSLMRLQPEKVWQNADILPALKRFGKLPLAPGEKWSYSNINYNLLAMVAEKQSGLQFAAYLDRFIFKPAGMTGAYLETSLTNTKNPNRAVNYALPAPYETQLKPVTELDGTRKWIYILGGIIGHGGLVMTAADLARFDQALYSGKLLKSRTLDEAFKPMLLTDGKPADASSSAGQASYGLGWFILNDKSAGRIVFHTGRSPGEVNIFIRNLDKKETVIVLDNAESEALYTTGSNAMKILDKQPQRVRKLSAAIFYAKALFTGGADAGAAKLAALRTDSATYELDPGEMDFMGHTFIERGEQEKGLEVLRTNLLLYPGIWQVYNGYASALVNANKKDEARSVYEMAVKLNPANAEAIKALSGK